MAMARGKKHTAEQIVNLLRQVEVGVANGKTLPQDCKEVDWRPNRPLTQLSQGSISKDMPLRKHSTRGVIIFYPGHAFDKQINLAGGARYARRRETKDKS
jgi:hypothetical protein